MLNAIQQNAFYYFKKTTHVAADCLGSTALVISGLFLANTATNYVSHPWFEKNPLIPKPIQNWTEAPFQGLKQYTNLDPTTLAVALSVVGIALKTLAKTSRPSLFYIEECTKAYANQNAAVQTLSNTLKTHAVILDNLRKTHGQYTTALQETTTKKLALQRFSRKETANI